MYIHTCSLTHTQNAQRNCQQYIIYVCFVCVRLFEICVGEKYIWEWWGFSVSPSPTNFGRLNTSSLAHLMKNLYLHAKKISTLLSDTCASHKITVLEQIYGPNTLGCALNQLVTVVLISFGKFQMNKNSFSPLHRSSKYQSWLFSFSIFEIGKTL